MYKLSLAAAMVGQVDTKIRKQTISRKDTKSATQYQDNKTDIMAAILKDFESKLLMGKQGAQLQNCPVPHCLLPGCPDAKLSQYYHCGKYVFFLQIKLFQSAKISKLMYFLEKGSSLEQLQVAKSFLLPLTLFKVLLLFSSHV